MNNERPLKELSELEKKIKEFPEKVATEFAQQKFESIATVTPYNAKAIAEGKGFVEMQERRLTMLMYMLAYEYLPLGAVEHLMHIVLDRKCNCCASCIDEDCSDKDLLKKATEMATSLLYYIEGYEPDKEETK